MNVASKGGTTGRDSLFVHGNSHLPAVLRGPSSQHMKHTHPEATLISEIPEITREIWDLAGGAGSSLGPGGMSTKLHAAERVTRDGRDMVIANGVDPEVLYAIVEGKPVGTRFCGRRDHA